MSKASPTAIRSCASSRAKIATALPRRVLGTAGTSTTSASTPRAIRTSRTASAGSSKLIRLTRAASRSSIPRWGASSMRAPGDPRADNRVVVYMGDDERNEYIYKFVSEGTYAPEDRAANMRLLERGTLYVARFSADGHWRMAGTGPRAAWPRCRGGLSQPGRGRGADPRRRRCGGATKMDRPEWIAVHPTTKEVYCTLTNNTTRGTDKGPAVDAANPRAKNVYGHIIRWREQGGDPCATRFPGTCLSSAATRRCPRPTSMGRSRGYLWLPGWALVRCTRRAVDPDRYLDQRRSIRATMPISAITRCWQPMWPPGDPALSDRTERLRGDRRGDDAGQPDHVCQHSAPGRDPSERSDPASPPRSVPGRMARASAFRDSGHPQSRRWRDRQLSELMPSPSGRGRG